jgi:hypothetical protein
MIILEYDEYPKQYLGEPWFVKYALDSTASKNYISKMFLLIQKQNLNLNLSLNIVSKRILLRVFYNSA